jgi:predicted small lipoprotein YifL
MKKVILSSLALGLVFTIQSCGEKAMDPAAVQAKVDSLAAIKMQEIQANAAAECETRMTTELKAMTDSMVNAMQMANAAN